MTVQQIGFDNDKYLTLQTERILSRVEQFGGKLYLEFGGKLFDDYHASRVLPGFQPDSKMRMLLKLRDQAELVVAISADDIEKSKRRGDLGITYDMDVMRLIDAFREFGLYVGSVVMTRFRGQHNAEVFQHKLEAMGIRVYRHYPIDDYPSNIPLIVSEGLRQKRLYRNHPAHRGHHGARPRLGEDGHLPEPALPGALPGHPGRLRQVRDLPGVEPASEAPGQPGL